MQKIELTATLPTQVGRIHVEFLDQASLRKLSLLRERQIRTNRHLANDELRQQLEISFMDYLASVSIAPAKLPSRESRFLGV